METKCNFCSEQKDDLITVHDSDGVKHLMCRGCLEHDESEVICNCGSANWSYYISGFIKCDICFETQEENNFFYLPFSVKQRHEKYLQAMEQYNRDKALCNALFEILRYAFDSVGGSR